MNRLVVLLADRVVGTVDRAGNQLDFRYDPAWPAAPDAMPLSLSLPLARFDHPPPVVSAFLWNLLPDNERILERWGARFQVSPRNPFGLIAHVGEDCAGAARFVRPERVEALLRGNAWDVEWLTDQGIEARLRDLRADPSLGREPADGGQFSLAGAQAKTALYHEDGRWGVPLGRVPTTHIFKPAIAGLDGHAENEHFCLALARRLNLRAARSEVRHFGAESAIVVERFDRLRPAELARATAAQAAMLPPNSPARSQAEARAHQLAELAKTNPILRLHQEDFCQALGLMPTAKYQNDRGPDPAAIVDLLRLQSSGAAEDVLAFRDALIFNWLICGTDAHAKNYSVLLGEGGQLRLAPLYDLASVLPYPDFDIQKAKLAMKIGGTYRIRDIGPRQWERLAQELRLSPGVLLDRARHMAEAMADQAPATRDQLHAEGLDHPIIGRLAAALVERARDCTRLLARPT